MANLQKIADENFQCQKISFQVGHYQLASQRKKTFVLGELSSFHVKNMAENINLAGEAVN